jgi:hypothetical protein
MNITSQENTSIGILLQGGVWEWTADIVDEYQNNFPNAEILLSTWDDQITDDISCEVIKTKYPAETSPHVSHINYQIVGCRAGLKKMKSSIIMKCRTDQFIHNRNIFELFLQPPCTIDKIMVARPQMGVYNKCDFFVNDFVQLAHKDILSEYWNLMPMYDGSYSVAVEIYLTRNYLQNIKKEKGSWSTLIDKYFCIKDEYLDWKKESLKEMKLEEYSKYYRIK